MIPRLTCNQHMASFACEENGFRVLGFRVPGCACFSDAELGDPHSTWGWGAIDVDTNAYSRLGNVLGNNKKHCWIVRHKTCNLAQKNGWGASILNTIMDLPTL